MPQEEKWDLKDLFKDDQQFYEVLEKTINNAKELNKEFKNKISPSNIHEVLDKYETILIQLDRLGNYAELRLSVETSNEEAQTLSAKLSTSYGKITSQLSFVESEISALSDSEIESAMANSNVPHYLQKIMSNKPYQLSLEVEEVLASLSPTFQSAYELYGTTKMLDIAFESFEHNNVNYP